MSYSGLRLDIDSVDTIVESDTEGEFKEEVIGT